MKHSHILKRISALILGSILFFGLGSTVSAAEYPDVRAIDWFYDYVQDVSEKGLMSGYTDTGCFGPTDKLTRGQFATILWRMDGEPGAIYDGSFPDVAGDEFYGAAVAWASENGIITGYSNNNHFGPNDYINREQLATILYRYAGSPETDATGVYNFPDGNSVNEFAVNGVAYAINNGIIKGDNGYIRPQGNVIRAECAAMISRYNADSGNNPPASPEQPADPENPTPHVHNWIEDENIIYQFSDTDIYICTCRKCGLFYGNNEDTFEVDYWTHVDETGHGSYTVVDVGVYRHLEKCSYCDEVRVGETSYYEYPAWKDGIFDQDYQYSIKLTPEQMDILGLPPLQQ